MKHQFQAEIQQLLNLMIHSIYSHREIFLRELISNASDAIDKRRFLALQEPALKTEGDNFIQLEINKDQGTLKIIDNGVGMNHDEVVQNIGTIAHSGTKKFLEMSKEMQKKPELIGQFGVGFYSSFMVADKVTLHTQKAGTNEGTLWISNGDGSYDIESIPRPGGAGTTITLFIKKFTEEEDAPDFLDEWTIKGLVKKYSDFIAYPVRMPKSKADAKSAENENNSTSDSETKNNSDSNTETKTNSTTEDFEVLNSQKALWLKNPSEITAEEYTEFYKHLSHDWEAPQKHIHYKAEGTMEFQSLLFIPAKKPWNYHYREYDHGLSLYIKRVFIMADCKDLLPSYLRFVKGLVDSSDLSLNISREMLQQDRQVGQIKKALTNKVLSYLKDLLTKERSEYEIFWKNFGPSLKEGSPQDFANKEKLQDLYLFHSTYTVNSENKTNSETAAESTPVKNFEFTTLAEYIERMPEGQKDIYFLAADNLQQAKTSPYLEKCKSKGYEVLLCVDPVDEFTMDSLKEFKNKKIQNITKDNLDFETEEEKKSKEAERKSLLERFQPLLQKMKTNLNDQIKEVRISDRLTETAVCLVSDASGPTAHMEKIMAQFQGADGAGMPASKRILEINPKHPVVEKMLSLDEAQMNVWSEILYGQALMNEGSAIPDPVKYSKLVNSVMLHQSH